MDGCLWGAGRNRLNLKISRNRLMTSQKVQTNEDFRKFCTCKRQLPSIDCLGNSYMHIEVLVSITHMRVCINLFAALCFLRLRLLLLLLLLS